MNEARTPTAPTAGDDGGSSQGADLALWMGQLLMDHGAESERVKQTVRSAGAGLGCAWNGVSVTYNALLASEATRGASLTRLREVLPRAVNMSMIEQLSRLNHRIARGELDQQQVRSTLRELEETPRHYSPTLTTLAVALACAAFSRLFQGDWAAFATTFAASASAMWVRHRYAKRGTNRLVFAAVSACIAGSLAGGLQTLFGLSRTPSAAFVACVLMLVPGVPAINAVQDFIKGHPSVAIARTTETALVMLAATLGLLLGLRLALVRI